MGRYFGTDGFRGEANVNLTADHAYEVGRFLGWYYNEKRHRAAAEGLAVKEGPARIVIGKDTRRSSYMFEYALVAGLVASGADAYMLHVTTTPSVAYIARVDDFDCGIMISASHNPYYDNGIKLINDQGEKMDEETIALVEDWLDGKLEVFGQRWPVLPFARKEKIGCTVDYISGRISYIGYLISLGMYSFRGVKVGLDCANGSSCNIAKAVFDALGADTYVINAEPNGLNINLNAGSTHIEGLQKFVVEKGLDVGFAYDGDADRLIACNERGEVIDGDGILYALACAAKAEGKLPRGLVVGTAYTNAGAERALAARGIRLLRAPVGDKFVAARMRESGAALGGEQSGHILPACSPAGDGILASLFLAALLRRGSLSALCALPRLAQVHIGVRLPPSACGASVRCTYGTEGRGRGQGAPPSSFPNNNREEGEGAAEDPSQTKTAETFADIEAKTGARLVVRPSGTEPVVRVFAEAESEAAARLAAEEAARAVLQSLQ